MQLLFSKIPQNNGRMVSQLISSVNAPQEVQNQFNNARTAERDKEVQESLEARNTLTTPTISVNRYISMPSSASSTTSPRGLITAHYLRLPSDIGTSKCHDLLAMALYTDDVSWN